MSKKITAGILLILALLFSACSAVGADGEGAGAAPDENYAEEVLAPDMQLIVGSLMLEDSTLTINAELATTLLPYWQMYLLLNESDGTAQEELDAVITEIQELMDPEQISYITDLQLTQESVNALVTDLGILEGQISEGAESMGDMEAPSPDGMPQGMAMGGEEVGADLGLEMQVSMQSGGEEAEESGSIGSQQASNQLISLTETLIALLEDIAAV